MKPLFKAEKMQFRPSRLDTSVYLFADPFDNYTLLTNVWDSVPSGSVTMSSLYARFAAPAGLTGQGVKFASGAYARKNLPTNSVTFIIGAAILFTGLPSGSTPANVICLLDGTTTQVGLCLTNAGALQFYRAGSGGTAIGAATANGIIVANVWHFFELVITIDPSAGAVALYLDGATTASINSTGLNTRQSSNTYANVLQIADFGNILGSNGPYFDDVRVFDSTGSINNAKLGDTRLITKMPSGAGDKTQWTANGAASNYLCTNSIPPNTGKYVSSATPGQEDTYAMQSAGLLAAPDFVVLRQYIEKDDSAARTMSPVMRSSGVDSVATAITLPSSYAFYDTLFPTDPNTSAAWTAAAADAAQCGQIEES